MKLMLEFIQSMWRMRWFWRVWVAALMLVNAVIPWFCLGMFEAQLVLLVFMLAAMTQMFIFIVWVLCVCLASVISTGFRCWPGYGPMIIQPEWMQGL